MGQDDGGIMSEPIKSKITIIDIEGEKVHLKKGMFGGYRIVNPILEEGEGPWHQRIIWINLLVGGWQNLITLLLLVMIVGGTVYFSGVQLQHDANFINLIFERIETTCPAFLSLNHFNQLNTTSIEDFKQGFLVGNLTIT